MADGRRPTTASCLPTTDDQRPTTASFRLSKIPGLPFPLGQPGLLNSYPSGALDEIMLSPWPAKVNNVETKFFLWKELSPVDNPPWGCAGKTGTGRRGMEAKLTFKYDREADILHIDKCPPYAAQESEELGDDVIARLNPNTREVENLEVLFFSTRLLRSDLFELPITANLRPAV